MTDPIITPAQMREAVEQAVLAEKMRMMSWCAKRQAVSRKAWERAARKALAGDMAELRNRIALIDAGPLDIVQSDTGGDALPVAEPEPQAPITLTYTNWRGETAERTIVPKRVWFGVTEWHPEPQWLLRAFDVEKRAERDFVLKDFGQKPEPQAAKVKPLQWVFHDATRNYSAVYISDGWTISRKGTGHFVLYNREFNEGMDRAYQTLEGAQAAAEADHAARILSQIEAVSAAQVRAEALEEAAKLPPYDGDGDPAGPFDHHVFVKRDAIRALIEKEPT